ncbi:alkaline phosphatase D family protein [Actinoplanes sp. NPDC051343]|uniref:alkaline phosphatase D family protein n=1 Tax=Actinoplanes sp. NPDC051343 TaxID=3363906 RepID=UPI0037ACD80A
MNSISRRTFVLGTAAAALVRPRPADPFRLGIASGDPAPDSVVLWTRLAPSPLDADGQGGMPDADVPVDWQIATTPTFRKVVTSGTVQARYADAHSVHVVANGLRPDAEYFYRFRARGHISPTGRTLTTPAFDAPGRDLTMLFACCSNLESGWFTAYRRMAEEHADLILHLGDYIYEGAARPYVVRPHLGPEVLTLPDYRRRYGQYKLDPDLQAAHAGAPWVVVPDDHDVEDDYAGTFRFDDVPRLTPAQWVTRRAAAYRAYYEHLPLRPSSSPIGNSIQLYRRLYWGRLATFHMLDTRQFRSRLACNGGWKACAEADLPARTITGAAQEAWLLDGLAQHHGTWDILGQQVFFAGRLDPTGVGNMDSWDGYRASRARIQQGWQDRHVRNPVVLTGDIHQAWANDLKADYRDEHSPTVGTELICTSLTSGGDGTGDTEVPGQATNPHLRFFSNLRGYGRARITPTQLTADFRALDYVKLPGAPATTLRSFALRDGHPGLHPF